MGLSFRQLALFLIVIVAIVVIVYVNQVGFSEAIDQTQSVIVDATTQVDIGSEELQGERPAITAEQELSIERLVKSMRRLAEDSDKKDCVVNYGGLVSLEGAKVSFQQQGKKVTVSVFDDKNRFVDEVKIIENMNLCLIVGGFIPTNFQNKWLDKDDTDVKEYYTTLNSFILDYDDKNQVSYSGSNSDLEDGGWLFKAKNNIVCMMPSSKVTSKWGLNNDYLTDSSENNFVGNKKLKLRCS